MRLPSTAFPDYRPDRREEIHDQENYPSTGLPLFSND
jgi:hypothetical protein